MKVTYYIGCSGWWYKDWDGTFYPQGLDEKNRLKYYTKHFNTTEINVTFYKLPNKKQFISWTKRTPDNFIFSIKAPQEITHKLHLLYAERIIKKFLETIEPLIKTRKIGAILFQCPPEFVKTQATLNRLKDFLNHLEQDLEYAIEFRHKSWLEKQVFELLEEYNIAYTIVDGPHLPTTIKITSNFTYIRFHGHGKKVWYYYNYKQNELEKWAKIIQNEIAPQVKKLYIYFNNHFRAYAPKNANEFITILGLKRIDLGLKPTQSLLSQFLKKQKPKT